jgi:hypothetical protein
MVTPGGMATFAGSSVTEIQALGDAVGTGEDGAGGGDFVYDLGVFTPLSTIIEQN